MKRWVAILLSLLLTMSLVAGCGAVVEEPESSNNSQVEEVSSDASGDETVTDIETADSEGDLYEKLTVALSLDPADLTPCKPNGIGKSNFMWSIYETLFDFDDDRNLIPNLATGYTEVSDTVWEVEIFQNIYDSEGNHITADDVVYAVNWVVESGNNIRYDIFESIEKVDEYTVAYHWKEKPASSGDIEWPFCRTFIFSQTAWENHNFAVEPVATGNFMVEQSIIGSSLVLKANPEYWALTTDEDVSMRMPYHTATVDTVEYSIIPESSSAVVALEMGTVDFCDYVPISMRAAFDEGGEFDDQYDIISSLSNDYYFLLPNLSSDVVGDDLNLRLAIYYALDNEVIAMAMGGSYLPLKTLGSTTFSDFDTSWEEEANYVNTYDLDIAKEYLDKSNYDGEEIVIVGLVTEETKNAMMMIQSILLDGLGLNVTIQPYEKSFLQTVVEDQNGDWNFYLSSVGGSTLVGSYSQLFSHDENNGYTNAWLQDDQLQELLDTASADATHDAEHMKELIDYAFSIGYVYPLTTLSSAIVYNSDISEICYREGYWTVGASTFDK